MTQGTYETRLDGLIDHERYPLDDLSSARAAAVIAEAQLQLQQTGAAELPGFLRPEAVERFVADSNAVRHLAYRTDHTHDIEFSGVDPATLPSIDPRRTVVRSAKFGTAYDLIPTTSPLRMLFESPLVTAFIGVILDAQPLYPMDDPLGALNVMFYAAGDELGWHFDNAEFAVTLMLQPSDEGGVFEYVPMLRTETDPNDAGVNALLAGSTTGLRTMPGAAGTLALFRGHWSPHRVTPIVGSTERINAVLAYSRRPDHRMSAHGQYLFYGRTKV